VPQLTVNYSDALVKLIRSGDAPIDGIEVGPWFTPKKIRRFQQELPEWPFHFHASSFISRSRYLPGTLNRLREYHSCTQNQWISVHIELLPLHVYLLGSRFGLHPNPPDFEHSKRKFVHLLERLKGFDGLPIILENLSSLPDEKYHYQAGPDIITEIMETTDSGLLLDISHARLAASFQGRHVRSYLEKLPLERMMQIHVSGIRKQFGRLRDAHESLQEEDYTLLKWVLGKCQPRVITLEYFRDQEPLRKQLSALREIIAG
jgi:uncharacterized protein (UPF0276 family)